MHDKMPALLIEGGYDGGAPSRSSHEAEMSPADDISFHFSAHLLHSNTFVMQQASLLHAMPLHNMPICMFRAKLRAPADAPGLRLARHFSPRADDAYIMRAGRALEAASPILIRRAHTYSAEKAEMAALSLNARPAGHARAPPALMMSSH